MHVCDSCTATLKSSYVIVAHKLFHVLFLCFRLFQHTRRPDDSYDYTKISSKINETCSETARAHNIVQPSISNRPNSARKRVNEKIVEKMRAKNEPKDLAVWDQIPQFGFLRYEEKELVSTSFTLSLSSSSAVYLSAEPRNVIHVPKKDLDILLVCIKLDSSGNFTQSAYISDLYDGQTFSLKVDLPPGSYSVIPFTMGSRFLRRKTQPKTCNFIQVGHLTYKKCLLLIYISFEG